MQTLHLGLNEITKLYDSEVRSSVLFMWSDCLLLNKNIISELNLYTTCSSVFKIPVALQNNPYAYIISEGDGIVNSIQYHSNAAIDYGLHDMSIFSINRYIFQDLARVIMNSSSEETLSTLVQTITCLGLKSEYYLTKYETASFNTQDELINILPIL